MDVVVTTVGVMAPGVFAAVLGFGLVVAVGFVVEFIRSTVKGFRSEKTD